MSANELVIIARLANHYEDRGVDDPLHHAERDVQKIKREAPELWRRLYNNSELSDRAVGDRVYALIVRWENSGMSFKNFAADELESGAAEPRVREARVVSDFNTLNDLIAHAASDLGATHISGSDAQTKIFFPRGGTYPYEEATVWRKNGYWHAHGPGAREGVRALPRDARPIRAMGGRRAAEASKDPRARFARPSQKGSSAPRQRPRAAKREFHIGQDVEMISNPMSVGHVAGFDPDGSVMVQWSGSRVVTGVAPSNLRVIGRGYADGRVEEDPRRGGPAKYRPGKGWRDFKVTRIVPDAGTHRVEFEDDFTIQVHGGHGRNDLLYAMKPIDLRHENRSSSPERRRERQYAAIRAVLGDRPAEFVVDHDGDVRAHLSGGGVSESRRVAEMTHLAEDILDGLGPYLKHEGHDAPRTASRIERMIMSAGRSDKKAEEVLEHVNKLIGGHGVEAVRDENAYDNYYGDVVATYVNMGDTYDTTLVHDARRGVFEVTSWGDWYEQYERNREEEEREEDPEDEPDDDEDEDLGEPRRLGARTKFPEPPKENKEDATEFYRRRNMPGVEVKYLESGPRMQTIELVRRGQTLGTAVKMFTRGKHTSTQYFLPQNIDDPLAGLPVAREGRRGGGDKARGAQYAVDQLEGDYFRQWAWGQMVEGAKLDPDKAIHDLKRVAKNMLQDVEHDTKRDLNESREFFEGFTEHLRKRETVEWLTKELETMQGEIESNGLKKTRSPDDRRARRAAKKASRPKARKPAKRKPRRR